MRQNKINKYYVRERYDRILLLLDPSQAHYRYCSYNMWRDFYGNEKAYGRMKLVNIMKGKNMTGSCCC